MPASFSCSCNKFGCFAPQTQKMCLRHCPCCCMGNGLSLRSFRSLLSFLSSGAPRSPGLKQVATLVCGSYCWIAHKVSSANVSFSIPQCNGGTLRLFPPCCHQRSFRRYGRNRVANPCVCLCFVPHVDDPFDVLLEIVLKDTTQPFDCFVDEDFKSRPPCPQRKFLSW